MIETLPLKGIKILDFTRLLPGPLGTHILSQMGADVVKIESPKRMDYTRFYQPQIDGVSTIFHSLNHTKTSLIIDYESLEGYHQVIEEIKTADIIIEQFRPEVMKNFNLSFDTIQKINPKIVYISITGYGQSGEKKDIAGHDLNYIAETGLLSLNKDEDGKPIIPGFQLADIGGSFMVVSACTTGLFAQRSQQKAQYIDVSIYDATMAFGAVAHGMLQGNLYYNKTPILSGSLVNYNVYQCLDNKWIVLAALETKFWNLFCDMVKRPSWKTYNIDDLSIQNFDKKLLDDLFIKKTRNQWVAKAKNIDVCLSPVNEISEVYSQNQTKDRELFEEVSIDKSNIKIYGKPFKTYTKL